MQKKDPAVIRIFFSALSGPVKQYEKQKREMKGKRGSEAGGGSRGGFNSLPPDHSFYSNGQM